MLIKNIYKLYSKTKIASRVAKQSLLLCAFMVCGFATVFAHGFNVDSTKSPALKDTSYKKFTYFRFGVDLSKIVRSQLAKDYKTYEFQIDANFSKQTSLAFEFGGGNSQVDNAFLVYKSSSVFGRLGIDKTFFNTEFKGDMDNAFVGIRLAFSPIQRNNATFVIKDQFWGDTSGVINSTRFNAMWIELNGGFRVELYKNIFAGWNVRAKTFLNPKRFELLPPSYLAGYGRGDKNTAFDFNFYILYGIGKRN